jgi:membrane protein YdbS with pleckstrin-like domain
VLACTIAFELTMLLAAGVLVLGVIEPPSPRGWVLLGAVSMGMMLMAWFRHAAARAISYAVREHDVVVRSGVFWKRETVQPILRIQHVERAQGPLDKRFGLAKLKLFSAGTGHSTFEIPGLDAGTALRIQSFLLEQKEGLPNRGGRPAPSREDGAASGPDA